MTMRLLATMVVACVPMFAQAAVTIVDENTPGAPTKPIIRPMNQQAADNAAKPVAPAKGELPSPPVPADAKWIIDPRTDKNYSEVFQRWADLAGWTLLWQLPKGYEPRNKSVFTGDFVDVFSKAAKGLGRAIGPLDVKFWRGNHVLTVSLLASTNAADPKKAKNDKGNKDQPKDSIISFVDDAYIGVGVDLPPEALVALARADRSAASKPGVSIPAKPVWTVERGAWLFDVLGEWAARAGWDFLKDSSISKDDDYKLGARDSYTDDFQGAVRTLIMSLPDSVRIKVQFVPENATPLLYVYHEEKK